MKIADNIIKEHLKNVYFLCGGAYGGKTTMAKLMEEKYGFIRYRQGDHFDEYSAIANEIEQPAMSMDRKSDWHFFCTAATAVCGLDAGRIKRRSRVYDRRSADYSRR